MLVTRLREVSFPNREVPQARPKLAMHGHSLLTFLMYPGDRGVFLSLGDSRKINLMRYAVMKVFIS